MSISFKKQRQVSTLLLILLLTVILLLSPKANALASIGVSPNYGPPLSSIKVMGEGFCTSCGPVNVGMNGIIINYGVPVDKYGQFSVLIEIPDSERPGANTVFANQNGNNLNATTRFEVVINPTENGTPNQVNSNRLPQTTPSTNKTTNSQAKNSTITTGIKEPAKSNNWLYRHKVPVFIAIAVTLVLLITYRYKFKKSSKKLGKK